MREDKLQMASSHILHMQKALVQMNIRLPEVLSQTHGASGMAMIEAILEGERDAQVLLSYCTTDLRKRNNKRAFGSPKQTALGYPSQVPH